MQFPSSLLSIFSSHAGTQQPSDGVLDVVNVIHPTLEIPESLISIRNSATGAGVVQLTSFAISSNNGVFGGAAKTETLCTIGPGLWDFTIIYNYSANYTITTSFGMRINFNDIKLNQSVIPVNVFPFNQSVADAIRFRLAIGPTRQIEVDVDMDANAAGNVHVASYTLMGNRLG